MHGTIQEPLLARADAAIENARKLQAELNENVAQAYAICRWADRVAAFQAGLMPTVAIALLVTERLSSYGPSSLGKGSCVLRPRNVSGGTDCLRTSIDRALTSSERSTASSCQVLDGR
jgi:hypothetical protein